MILPSVLLCMLEIRSLFMTTYTVKQKMTITLFWYKNMYMFLFRYSQSFDQHKYLRFFNKLLISHHFISHIMLFSCYSYLDSTFESFWMSDKNLPGREAMTTSKMSGPVFPDWTAAKQKVSVICLSLSFRDLNESKCTLEWFHPVVTVVLYK